MYICKMCKPHLSKIQNEQFAVLILAKLFRYIGPSNVAINQSEADVKRCDPLCCMFQGLSSRKMIQR